MRNVLLTTVIVIIAVVFNGCKKDCGGSCETGGLSYLYYTIYKPNGDTLLYKDIIGTQVNNVNTDLIPINLKEIQADFYNQTRFIGGFPVKFCYEETGEYIEFDRYPGPPYEFKSYPLVRLCSIEFNQ